MSNVKNISETAYTLSSADNGMWLTFSSGSAVTVTVPSTLVPEFECVIQQIGVGAVTIAAGGNGATATLRNVDGFSAISGRYGIATLKNFATNEFVLSGNLA